MKKRSTFKTWLVETAVGIWGAVSFIGITLVEGVDGGVHLLPFCIPSMVSLVLCAKVFTALEKKGYFAEPKQDQSKSGQSEGR